MNALDVISLITGLSGIAGLIFVFRFIYHSRKGHLKQVKRRPSH